jgi:L-fuconate dehydratase
LGKGIEEVMAEFGRISRAMADHPALRWLGPHKGVVHLALASISNACFDLWAKTRGLPLWKLLLDLEPEALVRAIDLSYLEDVLTFDEAVAILRENAATRTEREPVIREGYPGYDTSVGWMAFDDEKVKELTRQSIARGFRAVKLKVGSHEEARDLRRAEMLRECLGSNGFLMFDVNQQWSMPQAARMCAALRAFEPLWIEEPTHPDDVYAHAELARQIAPVRIACGEHVANRVLFKNYLHYDAVHYVQADCTRLAGIGEFLAVSLLARKFGKPVVPHIGDMGQIHQHLALFNHIALGNEKVFLEHIPYLRQHFVHPVQVEDGKYKTPQEPGASTDMKVGVEVV